VRLDRRALAADTVVIPLRSALPAAPGSIAAALVVHDGLILEDVLYRLSDSGRGSAGQAQLDLLLDGATLYPSVAQDDHRPVLPFDTADLIVQGRIHELTELHPGQLSSSSPSSIRPAPPPPGRRPISSAVGRDASQPVSEPRLLPEDHTRLAHERAR
jgi:hypothetical protein